MIDASTLPPHLAAGQKGEDRACRFLEQQGLQLITRNYSCRMGEIDLIMQDQRFLVFVEVRYRSSHVYGGSAMSVTRTKQQKIIRAALFYLQQKRLYNKVPCRFDVLAITGEERVEWIKNAFQYQPKL